MYIFFSSIWAYKSKDIAQSQENVARSHDCDTVIFRNSGEGVWGRNDLDHRFNVFIFFIDAFPEEVTRMFSDGLTKSVCPAGWFWFIIYFDTSCGDVIYDQFQKKVERSNWAYPVNFHIYIGTIKINDCLVWHSKGSLYPPLVATCDQHSDVSFSGLIQCIMEFIFWVSGNHNRSEEHSQNVVLENIIPDMEFVTDARTMSAYNFTLLG